jgi:dolichyl-phosphate beta-glucosyltransferase
MTLVVAGVLYLALGFLLWVHAWTEGATTHTLCGCGDPALFLWFFQWPATALSHGQNPFYSTALFHPHGINLLAQTSVTGMSLPLVPVTWIWGPVASLNVASTVAPALTAFTAFIAIRRWVTWTPASFVGGLLYGFSPFVLTSLEFAHLMTAALMVLPLILIALDEIVVRQRRSALWTGLLLGLLVFAQFFFSTELLAITAIAVVIALIALVGGALVTDRAAVRQRARHAAVGLGAGLGVGVVLLAWPIWFALAGPAHLSGAIWPNIAPIGGYVPADYVSPHYIGGSNVFELLGGYTGAQLGSSGYLGWGLLAVLVAGLVAFRRDRRLWFFGFVLAFSALFALGERRGQWWELARILAHIPVMENVIVQRFMAIGFLAAAVMLAIVLDRVRARPPDWRRLISAVAVAAIALVPIGVTFGERLPFAMTRVLLPRWYTEVAPTLPPGRVLLSYPAPFTGIQSAMAWQAVDRMHYSQAGGGGPQGTAVRSGAAAGGFRVLTKLTLNFSRPSPTGTPAQYAAVRQALRVWKVDSVVVSTDPAAPFLQQGQDPVYAAAFMTAALGRLPRIEAGAWVWNDVQADTGPAFRTGSDVLNNCTRKAEGTAQQVKVTMQAPLCVGLQALAHQ